MSRFSGFVAYADAVSAAPPPYDLKRQDWGGMFPPQSLLYVDDGIFTERSIPGRLGASSEVWGSFAIGVLGDKSVNGESVTKRPSVY